MSVKIGDVVRYTEGTDPKTKQPVEYSALVLLVRVINTQFRNAQGEIRNHDHTGANGEPLVTLAIAKERTDASGSPLVSRPEELVQIRLDVAHDSHEFSDEEKKYFGKTRYDGGRWSEIAAPKAPSWPKGTDKKQ